MLTCSQQPVPSGRQVASSCLRCTGFTADCVAIPTMLAHHGGTWGSAQPDCCDRVPETPTGGYANANLMFIFELVPPSNHIIYTSSSVVLGNHLDSIIINKAIVNGVQT